MHTKILSLWMLSVTIGRDSDRASKDKSGTSVKAHRFMPNIHPILYQNFKIIHLEMACRTGGKRNLLMVSHKMGATGVCGSKLLAKIAMKNN